MKKKYIWWLLAIAWCIFIFLKSNKPAVESAEESMFVTVYLNNLLSIITGTGMQIVSDNFVRKTAHFLEYFVLGFLLFKAYFNADRLKMTFYMSTATAILYSISDEIHQYFVPGRAMRATDVMIDSAGIMLAVVILTVLAKRAQKLYNQ